MARTTVILTEAWQQVGTATRAIITVSDGRCKRIYLNEVASDDAAEVDIVNAGRQFAQTEQKDTFARCDVDGDVTIIVDSEA
jgi:hypothetical protein